MRKNKWTKLNILDASSILSTIRIPVLFTAFIPSWSKSLSSQRKMSFSIKRPPCLSKKLRKLFYGSHLFHLLLCFACHLSYYCVYGANYSTLAICGLPSIFIDKAVLEHSPQSFVYIFSMAAFGPQQQSQEFSYLALYRKSWPTLDTKQYVFKYRKMLEKKTCKTSGKNQEHWPILTLGKIQERW